MDETGSIRETYVAAIQHDLVSLSGTEYLAGVGRRPTPWFYAAVDDNHPALGPPDDLLEETKTAEERFVEEGLDDAAAIEAAWDAVAFADRYRAYVRSADAVAEASQVLIDRLETGQDVVLVCFEATDKPCHRHLLRDALRERVPARG